MSAPDLDLQLPLFGEHRPKPKPREILTRDGVPAIPRSAASHRDALLALLSDGRPHTGPELEEVAGNRYGARLFEARQLGFRIDRQLVSDEPRVYSYRLVSVPR